MADFDFSAPQASDSDSNAEPPPQPVGPKRRKKAPGSDNNTPSKKDPKLKLCFIADCDSKKLGKSKFCGDHKKVTDAILYQAGKAGKKQEVERTLSDPTACTKAVREFEAENPPGRFRKKLIDFTQWLKTYSVETASTSRDVLELYTFQDFSDEKTAAGWEPSAILSKWQGYVNSPDIDREDDENLWLPKRKQKLRDVTRRVNNSVVEGSKSMKSIKPQDLDALKTFAGTSAAPHTHSFLRNKEAFASGSVAAATSQLQEGLLGDDDDNVSEPGKKKRKGKKVDLSAALPTTSDKELGQINKLREQISTAVAAAKAAMDRADSVKSNAPLSQAGDTFYKTCKMRCACGVAWLIGDEGELASWETNHGSGHFEWT